jgi:hypothetical protein
VLRSEVVDPRADPYALRLAVKRKAMVAIDALARLVSRRGPNARCFEVYIARQTM